jgi:hypothetical protein
MIWIEIPKNASFNFKNAKLKFDSNLPVDVQPNALLKKVDKIDLSEHKRGFVILRNPIDRFKSLLSHYFIEGYRTGVGKYWLYQLGINNVDNNNIVDIVFDNWDKIGNIGAPHHFNSQSFFIPKEFFQINHITYDINEINFMFGLEMGVNSSASSDIQISNKNLEKIIDIYKDDIKLYQKYFKLDL